MSKYEDKDIISYYKRKRGELKYSGNTRQEIKRLRDFYNNRIKYYTNL